MFHPGRPGLILLAGAIAAGCVPEPPAGRGGGSPASTDYLRGPGGTAGAPDDLTVRVLRTYPHDARAFTQGLVYHGGRLYESTGLEGASSLRRVDLVTGQVDQQIGVAAPLFGEGLARVGDTLVQLTWKDGRALVWQLDTFWPVREHRYPGEGWGLCHDGRVLVMSDGSERLTFRAPDTFAPIGDVMVTRAGQPVRNLNELECVGGLVYANVWGLDHIARIDPQTGAVTAWIDASGLLFPEVRAKVDALNGIAFVPERGTFLLTGKYWPLVFEVTFVPRAAMD